MKTKLLFSIFCILLFSCKKEPKMEVSQETSKTYRVNFSVNGFSQVHEGLISSLPGTLISAKSPTGTLKYLTYLCYTEEGQDLSMFRAKLVDSASRTSADPDFGKFYSNLPAGKYRVYIIGSTCPINLLLPAGFPPSLLYLNNRADLAYAKTEITVSDEPLSQDIKLKRMVGQIEFVLNDSIPASLQRIEAEIVSELQGYHLEMSFYYPDVYFQPKNVTVTQNIRPSDVGKKGYRFAFFVLNTPGKVSDYPTLDLYLRGYGKDNVLLAEKAINYADNQTNVKTTYRGSLFESSPAAATTSFKPAGKLSFADLSTYNFRLPQLNELESNNRK